MVRQLIDPGHVLRCRGFSEAADEESVLRFFDSYIVLAVHFLPTQIGKNRKKAPPPRECCVQFADPSDAEAAVRVKHGKTHGGEYIEVKHVNNVELYELVQKHNLVFKNSADDIPERYMRRSKKGYVHIRGLPYKCTRHQLSEFFHDLPNVNPMEVLLGKASKQPWRPTGEAFVSFRTADEARDALQLRYHHIGERFLEISETDEDAFEAFRSRHCVRREDSSSSGNGNSLPKTTAAMVPRTPPVSAVSSWVYEAAQQQQAQAVQVQSASSSSSCSKQQNQSSDEEEELEEELSEEDREAMMKTMLEFREKMAAKEEPKFGVEEEKPKVRKDVGEICQELAKQLKMPKTKRIPSPPTAAKTELRKGKSKGLLKPPRPSPMDWPVQKALSQFKITLSVTSVPFDSVVNDLSFKYYDEPDEDILLERDCVHKTHQKWLASFKRNGEEMDKKKSAE